MTEYGSGVTMEQSFEMDRERIEKALQGKLICGETEDGFEYCEADKKECDQFILDAFDNAVYWAIEMMITSNAYNDILEKDLKVDLGEIFKMYRARYSERKAKQNDQ